VFEELEAELTKVLEEFSKRNYPIALSGDYTNGVRDGLKEALQIVRMKGGAYEHTRKGASARGEEDEVRQGRC